MPITIAICLYCWGGPGGSKKEALRITTAFPGNPTFLSTLLLAELLNGDPKEALRAMNQRGPVPLNHGEKANPCVYS